jgi:hypothetical protein
MTALWIAIGALASVVLIGQAVKASIDKHVRRAMDAQRSRDAVFDRHAGQAIAVANPDTRWTGIDEIQLRREIRKAREE